MDEAAQLSTYADQFDAWAEADDDDPALVVGGEPVGYAALSAWAGEQDLGDGTAPRVHVSTYDTELFLRILVSTWEADAPPPAAIASAAAAETNGAAIDVPDMNA